MNNAAITALAYLLVILAGLLMQMSPADSGGVADNLQMVRQKAMELDHRIQRIEDENAIENLQRTYGFLVDKALWHEVADLFTDDGTLEIGGRGVFAGKSRIYQYLLFLGKEGPQYGRLMDHMQLQPVVHVAPDGRTAQGRWRFLARGGELPLTGAPGTPGSGTGYLGMGTYENEYVKQDGTWKIRKLHAYFRMYTRDVDGWGKIALPITRPQGELPPDQPPSVVYDQYPSTFIPPFHYRHPVSGK
jgi:hypothetical protein